MKVMDFFYAALATFFWGSGFVAITIGFDYFPPIFFVALRFLILVPLVFIIPRNGIQWRWIFSVGFLLGVCVYGLWYVGMYSGMPTGTASLLLQTQSVFTILFAIVILKDIPTKYQKWGTVLAFAGMLIIGAKMISGGTLLSFFIILAAAMFWGVLNIIMKKSGNVEQYRLMVWASLIPPLPLIGLSFIFEEGQRAALMDMTLLGVLILLYTGVLGTVVAFAIWGKLIQKYSPTVISPFSLLVPIYATFLSAVILGEEFDLLKIVGSVTVFTGLGLIVSGERIVKAVTLRAKYSL